MEHAEKRIPQCCYTFSQIKARAYAFTEYAP